MRPNSRTRVLSFLEQSPAQSQTRVDRDALRSVLAAARVAAGEYCVARGRWQLLAVHALGAADGTVFVSVCRDDYPTNGAHFCLQEAKSKVLLAVSSPSYLCCFT